MISGLEQLLADPTSLKESKETTKIRDQEVLSKAYPEIISIESRRKRYVDYYSGETLKGENPIKFKYSSEYHLATVLEHFGLPWRYRPAKFPLDSKPIRNKPRFTPSFYLPNEGLFIKICLRKDLEKFYVQIMKLKEIDPNIEIDLFPTTNSLFEKMYNRITKIGDTIESVKSKNGFANESELEFARLFDSLKITWRYEPVVFPLEWDENGRATESFRPDFHLPQSDWYIELTVMKQALVTEKNRKIRKFREKYPKERLEVIYEKDFNRIKEKLMRSKPLIKA
nr:hypothetical protein [Candidatus Woesearchaeota archaeon]